MKDFLLDLMFPIECLGCGKDDEWFCPDCRRRLEIQPRQTCVFCESINLTGATCAPCRQKHSLDGCFCAGDYEQRELMSLIKTFKYSLIPALSQTIASHMACALKAQNHHLLSGKWLSLPIPLHHKREKWRGFNQSALIADILNREFGWQKASGLIRKKNHRPQAKMKGLQRLKNVQGCFSYQGADISGRRLILIDDVLTTGSTM